MLFSILSIFLFTGAMNANAITISDIYWWAGTTPHWSGRDQISHDYFFELSQTFNSDVMYADTDTSLSIIGQYQREFDNLFVSTNGWNPTETASYTEDSFDLCGNAWRYELILDTNAPNNGQGSDKAGAVSYYHVNSSQIRVSSAPNSQVYRQAQDVAYNGMADPLATGEWSIGNWSDPNTDVSVRFAMDCDLRDVSELGHQSTITRANDVIEDGVSEPATMLLLGAGLIGLSVVGRKGFLVVPIKRRMSPDLVVATITNP